MNRIPIRVLHTVRSLRLDGVVTVILRNVTAPGAEGFRHYVCGLRPDRHLVGAFQAAGVEPIVLRYRGVHSIPGSVARVARIIRGLGIDVVHANRTFDLAIAGAAAKLCRIPVVSTLHWMPRAADHPYDPRPWWQRHGEGVLVPRLNRLLADRIIAVSEAVAESARALPGFPPGRIEVVFPGLDMGPESQVTADERARRRAELGIDATAPVLLNVGRLQIVKGQRHLVPMMRAVRRHVPDAVLLIAGEGELRAPLEQAIAREGLESAIRLLGARSDVAALMALSDVIVLASESEAAPLPLLEAARAGRPAVATRVGGVPEIVVDGETGILVPRGDPDAMAAAVLRLIADPGLACAMGTAARRRATQRFDLTDSVRALERVYRELVEGRRTAARAPLATLEPPPGSADAGHRGGT